MTHVVDLIQYAQTNIDAGIKSANKLLARSVQASHEGVEYLRTQKKKLHDNPQVRKVTIKVETATVEAVKALSNAADSLGRQINVHHLSDRTKQLAQRTFTMPKKSIALFSEVAHKTKASLQNLLDSLLHSNSENSPQFVAEARAKINAIVDSLLTLLHPKKKTSPTDQTTPEPVKPEQEEEQEEEEQEEGEEEHENEEEEEEEEH